MLKALKTIIKFAAIIYAFILVMMLGMIVMTNMMIAGLQ